MGSNFNDYISFLYDTLTHQKEERPGQRALLFNLAERISDVAEGRRNKKTPLMIPTEAPTGTGKSYVLLLLALAAYKQYGWKSVISSQTKVLQQQLVGKDIPAVRRAISKVEDVNKWSAGIVKGMGNYPCLRKLTRLMKISAEKAVRYKDSDGSIRVLTRQDVRGVYVVLKSSKTDLDKSILSEDNPVLAVIRADRQSCIGKECKYYNRYCPYQNAIRSRQPLVVTNHAMLTGIIRAQKDSQVLSLLDDIDRQSKTKKTPPTIMGADLYFFDEAHHLMNYSSAADTIEVISFRDIDMALVSPLPIFINAGEEIFESAVKEIELCRDSLKAWWKKMADLFDHNPWAVQNKAGIENNLYEARTLLQKWGQANTHFLKASANSEFFLSIAQQMSEDIEISSKYIDQLADICEIIRLGAGNIRVEDTGIICFSDKLRSLEEDMKESLKNIKAAIFTSGTLLLRGNANVFCAETGIKNPTPPIAVESPFDFKHMVVWIPRGIPNPSMDYSGHDLAVMDFVTKYVPPFVRAGLGGVLILCSSLERMRGIGRELSHILIPQGKDVLVQGSLPRGQLAKKFVHSDSPVLVASASFREGFDATQQRLTWVIIDKLPFLSPGDKGYMERIRRLVKWGVIQDPFDHALDLMHFSLIQAVGRLIRKNDDWGGVTILDSRIWDKGFSWGLDRCIPIPPSEWIDAPKLDVKAWNELIRRMQRNAKSHPLEQILESLPDPFNDIFAGEPMGTGEDSGSENSTTQSNVFESLELSSMP